MIEQNSSGITAPGGVKRFHRKGGLRAIQATAFALALIISGTASLLADDCFQDWKSAMSRSASTSTKEKAEAADLHGQAFAAHSRGNFQESERLWCSAIRKDPGNVKYLFNLSCSRGRLGKIGESLDILTAAFQIDGQKVWVRTRNESDLAGIRQTPAYRNLMRDHAPAPSSPEELLSMLALAMKQADPDLFSQCLSGNLELETSTQDPQTGRDLLIRYRRRDVDSTDLLRFRKSFYDPKAWKHLQAKPQMNTGPYIGDSPQGVNPDDFVVRFVTDFNRSFPSPGSGNGMVCESFSDNALYLRKTEKGWFLVAATKTGNGGC